MEVDRVSRMENGTRTGLRRLLAKGEYVVDPEAVAEAIIQRGHGRGGSGVLVPAQLFDELPSSPDEGETTAAPDLA
jgi:hypothetical protein